MRPIDGAIVASVALVIVLAAIRAVEILNGHTPTAELTGAFSSAVGVCVALLAAGHIQNGLK